VRAHRSQEITVDFKSSVAENVLCSSGHRFEVHQYAGFGHQPKGQYVGEGVRTDEQGYGGRESLGI